MDVEPVRKAVLSCKGFQRRAFPAGVVAGEGEMNVGGIPQAAEGVSEREEEGLEVAFAGRIEPPGVERDPA